MQRNFGIWTDRWQRVDLGAQLQTKPCEHHAELLRKIAGLCNNANQLAHVANGTGMAGEASVQEMLRISKETWRLVKEEW